MKKATIARFVIGLAAISAVGCSAETGAPEAEGVGATEQAINIAGLAAGHEAKFPSLIKLSSTEVLVLGGYDHTGAAISTIKKFTYTGTGTGTWANFGSPAKALSTARGEAEIIAIPSQAGKFLIVGGRSSDGGTRLDTAEIIDTSTPSVTPLTSGTTHKLASPRVNFKLAPCGTSKLMVLGGQENTPSAVTTLEVFTYDSGTPANSTFATLKSADNHTTPVALSNARFYHGVLPSSTSKIIAFGGDSGAGVLTSTEIINVDSSCEFVDGDGAHTLTVPATGPTMPAARKQFASAPVSLTISGVTYEYLVAGGTDGSTAVTTTLAYDDQASPAWTATGTPSLNAGHILPVFAEDGAGAFVLAGGLSAPSGSSNVTTTASDYYASGSFSSSPSLSTATYGSWASYIGGVSTPLVGMGVRRTFTAVPVPTFTETSQTRVE